MEAKRLAAEKAVEFIEDGMRVGLGTGSTAYWAIRKIGERVQQGLKLEAIASSLQSEELAREFGIPFIASPDRPDYLDVAIDGADEVDNRHNLVKGGGGALLREKIIAWNSKKFIVVVDESKLVDQMGRHPLPIEIIPFAAALTIRQLERLAINPVIRQAGGKPFVTDNGNLVADCRAYPIADPAALNAELHKIPGVVETGLFLAAMVSAVIVGYNDGRVEVRSGAQGKGFTQE